MPEVSGHFNFFLFSTGLNFSAIAGMDSGFKNWLGIKPQIGFDFYVFKCYYGYQFSIGDRPSYLNSHTISLSLFLAGKNESDKLTNKTGWYSWSGM